MPGLQRVYEEYKPRGLVNTWEESNSLNSGRGAGYTYALVLQAENVTAAYRVSSLPTLCVIGVDGTIIYRLSRIDDNLGMVIEGHPKEHER
jgi:hypothetical protein